MLPARDYKPRAPATLCSEAFLEANQALPMTSDIAVPVLETVAANGHGDAHTTAGFGALMLGSIGVVYGDIGTSPLYAFREAVMAAAGTEGLPTPAAVLGVLSQILWVLFVVVLLFFVVFLFCVV